MKLLLTSNNLCYVSTGTGKMHIQFGTSRRVLCGKILPRDAEPHVARRLSPEQYCKSCGELAVLHHGDKVQVESEAGA